MPDKKWMMDPDSNRITAWVATVRWSVLLALGFGLLLLHRLLGIAVGMPGWISGMFAFTAILGLAIWKVALGGGDTLRDELRSGWQMLSDWLAVTGWGRLLTVGLFVLITVAVGSSALSEDGDPVALVVSGIFGLIALKIARASIKPRQDEALSIPLASSTAAPASALPPASEPDEIVGGTWLQRLTWTRLILLGLLLLIAAAAANSLFDADKHPFVVVDTSDTKHKAGRAAKAAAEARAAAEEARRATAEAGAVPAAPEAPAAPAEIPAIPAIPPIPSASAPEAADASGTSDDGNIEINGKDKDVSVKIGTQGIVISERGHDGKTSKHVVIGPHGIDVSKGKRDPDNPEDISIAELRGIPGMTEEKAQELEDRIREEIESASERAQNSQRGFNFASLAFLAVISLAIMKLLAGGKRKAEQAAGNAQMAADMARLEREAADAKLHAMQAQIEPHFLFNTLASVDQLIRTDPPRASQVQKTLIQYLRAAIPDMRDDAQRSTLGRQVKMSQAYLEIMQVRMEERLSFGFRVPEGLSCAEFPSMMLQTLIENCIKHGLEPKPEGGRIEVEAEVSRSKLRVRVLDTGVGFTADAKDGIGLANIRERLRLLYGSAASVTLSPNPGGGTIALVELPYRDEPDDHGKVC